MNCGGIRNRLTICLTFLLTILIFTPMSHLQKKTFWSTFCTPQSHPAMHPFYFSVTAPLWHILHNLQTALLLYIHQTTPNFRFIRLAVHVGYHSQHSSCQSVPSGEVGAGPAQLVWSEYLEVWGFFTLSFVPSPLRPYLLIDALGCKKKGEKLTNVSFMYVCVTENGEMLGFFPFFPNNSLNRQLSFRVDVLNHMGWYLGHKGLL